MTKYDPIMLIEDDLDDVELFKSVITDLHVENTIFWFPNTESAMHFLLTTDETIFLIFCDINLPGRNGLDFKKDVDETPKLRKKSIPFVFYSTVARKGDVERAYTEMVVQGFFKKETSYGAIKKMLRTIMDYWKMCKHPNAL